MRTIGRTTVFALAASLCWATSPAALAAVPKPAKLAISSTSYAFGQTLVGSISTSQSFAVTNTGQSTSGPLAVTLAGNDVGDYAVDANTCTGTLAAGSACSVSVHFAPTAVKTRTASLSVTGTPGGTVKSTLQGTGTSAHLDLSPTSHGYGSVAIGASSDSQTYTLTNTGAGPSGPVSFAVSGANAADFVTTSSTCGAAPIAAGASCTVSIVFTPTAAGARAATLTASATPGGSVTSALRGTGAAKALLAVTPSSFDYGAVVVGSSSATQTYTVKNIGLATSGLLTVALGGADPSSFSQDSTTCGAKLAVGASCTVSVHYLAVAAGTSTATLSVTAAPGSTATVSLQGTGSSPAALSITPTTFDFGAVALGSESGTQSFAVTNTGQGTSGPLTLAVAGAQQADFAAGTTSCGDPLPGGASCTIEVRYAPSVAGMGTATVSVTSSPGGTASVVVQGTGITPAVLAMDPTTFDFGSALVGASTAAQTFTVTNTGQAASGAVSVTSTGTNAAAFVIDGTTCGAALAGGASCTVTAHFTPSASGAFAGGLSATATPGETTTAAVQGQGLGLATLSISPAPGDLGQTPIGVTTAAKQFVVTNTGQSTSGSVALSLSGPNAGSFALGTSTCGVSLAAGASCTVALTFMSFSTGSYAATLTAQASPGGSATSALTAQAITPAYFNNSSTLDFGPWLLGGSTTAQTVIVKNFGQQTTGALTVALSGANPGDFIIEADTCVGVLVGGASCSITIHFSPGALGARSATVKTSATPGGIQTNPLQGRGVNALTVDPATYTFPNQNVGTTSAAVDFTLTNYSAAPLGSFTISASDTVDLPITADTCVGATLNSGASCKVSVAFNAANLGAHSSTMNASFTDPGNVTSSVRFQASGTSIVPPPDLATAMTVLSQNFSNAFVQISVTNLGSATSVPATLTINVNPTQSFSYSAGAGTDCTASIINAFGSRFVCPVPAIAPGATYTRLLSENNLSSQGPHYVQNDATTVMAGDTNSSNNTAYALVTFN